MAIIRLMGYNEIVAILNLFPHALYTKWQKYLDTFPVVRRVEYMREIIQFCVGLSAIVKRISGPTRRFAGSANFKLRNIINAIPHHHVLPSLPHLLVHKESC